MKKRNVFVATCVTLMLVTGCSAQKGEVSSAVPTQIVSTSIAESTLDVSSTKNAENRMDEEESTLTGTISDIKDFTFLALKEKNQKDYLLSKKEIQFLLFTQENWKKQKHSLEL